jgi:hypothetical protein
MSNHPLDCLAPTDQPLLDILGDRVDDSMLLEIARCDYGDDVELHLAALHEVKANNISAPMQWYPGEVLCLTRWTELDNLALDKAILDCNHWMRLFACTALIIAALDPEEDEYETEDWSFHWNHVSGINDTMIQLLDSALYLGEDVSMAALQFLGWRMQCHIRQASIDEDFSDCPCYAVAILLLCVSLDRCNDELVRFLISMAYYDRGCWPISREIDGQRTQKWRDTIDRILFAPTAPVAVRENLAIQKLAMELMDDPADSLGNPSL